MHAAALQQHLHRLLLLAKMSDKLQVNSTILCNAFDGRSCCTLAAYAALRSTSARSWRKRAEVDAAGSAGGRQSELHLDVLLPPPVGHHAVEVLPLVTTEYVALAHLGAAERESERE